MTTKFFTNKDENTLISKFEGVFKYNPNIHYFDALVGYFRASGYFRIRPLLEKVPKIRILVGINVDKLLAEAQKKGFDFFRSKDRTKEEFIQEIKEDIQQTHYDQETEKGILQFIKDIITKKVEVKAHPDKKIHAKVYIFRPEPFNQHTPASVITGSSNLTDAGLGASTIRNYEFNVQLNDYEDVKFATEEFEILWKEAVDILPVDVQNIEKKTYLNDDITPFELYIKLLIEYFGESINYDPDSIGDLPANFKKLSYQIDAVNEGFHMLLKHNGFILADVVGLGKTVVATMVAKKFILQNGKENTKILVIYPPAVEKNWKNTFKYFGIDKYAKFITNGSLHKILEGHSDYWNKEEYDLIIVDEAHKFRNHTTGAFQNLQLICKSPRANKGHIEGLQKKVILVTATPLNNKPDDIFHQILMFQDARQSTLPITNLTSFFASLVEEYKALKRTEKPDIDKLRNIYGKIRKNIIEPITIRRTRKDIENIPEYQKDLAEQGIRFPKVEPPKKIEYVMNEKLNQLFYKTVFYLIDEDKLNYARYQAIAGLKPEAAKGLYERAELASKSLAMIMKTLLIKRLESSFYAFKKSLNSFQKATDRMIKMFENDKIFIAPDTDINKLLEKGWSEEEIEKEIERLSEENPKNRVFKASDFKPEFIQLLKKDKKNIDDLVNSWQEIEDDPKLEVFLQALQTQFLNKKTNIEGKLVIFSESKDTTDYLKKRLEEQGRTDVLTISSENRNDLYETIVANFDANCEHQKQKNDYNILITTEVLAEGVNLHRSNVIVHYDTPWNATRLIQRIGRVNRIGTKADTIYNYVFYPSAQGDSQIQLNKTALTKIQAFHTAFGEDNQVYSQEEILDEVKLFNKEAVREEEDERLKYLYFLRKFRDENKSWFEKIKKLPLKSRTGRNSTTLHRPELQNGTAVFLKNSKKFEFYWVDSQNQPYEITPLEAFKIFEAQPDEKSCQLIENHHKHVAIAINHFQSQEYKLVALQETPEALGGVAQSAKKFLFEIVKHPIVSESQKENIQKIILLIDIGKFTNLATDINKLRKKIQKKVLKLNDALAELDKIALQYGVQSNLVQKESDESLEKPVLIISESFE
ncbi:helicase-related protein [Raineya orbicola]|uniref:SNF2 family N-terminal domain n=1 Tax=Raineya orbicola TaxID=2016530 RepID=A0A2N3IDJ4_9BACT|nr:helicase-related protein [Raineya orbicola]PKQ68345.1 SNF2 family N-terminal domain [Raineya orbicola]